LARAHRMDDDRPQRAFQVFEMTIYNRNLQTAGEMLFVPAEVLADALLRGKARAAAGGKAIARALEGRSLLLRCLRGIARPPVLSHKPTKNAGGSSCFASRAARGEVIGLQTPSSWCRTATVGQTWQPFSSSARSPDAVCRGVSPRET
jgi:hypothetical protein